MSSLADVLRTRIQTIENNEGVELSIKLLPRTVLRHLLQSWSASSQRAFARTTTDGTISLAFGLGAVHYYISKGQDFNKMLLGGNEELVLADDNNPFLNSAKDRNYGFNDELRSGGDVWSLSAVASTEGNKSGKSTNASGKVQTLFAAYDCKLVDTSPGGYCLEWSGVAPTQLKTGEITTIREPGQEDWSVAVVRWIKKVSNTQVRLGLELLAPHAEAVGAKVIQKDGSSTEYMRAIRLPELKAIGQPSTLITPQLTFRPGYKVLLNIDSEEVRLHLNNEISSTASFSQFEYKLLGEKAEKQTSTTEQNNSSSEDNDEFNSLWSSI